MKKWVCRCRWIYADAIIGTTAYTVDAEGNCKVFPKIGGEPIGKMKNHTEKCKKRTANILAFKKQDEARERHYQACEDAEYEEVARDREEGLY